MRECRRRKAHRFDGYTVGWRNWEGQWVYEETEQCPECTTTRWRYVAYEDNRYRPAGSVLVKWVYRYPPGYLLPAGAGEGIDTIRAKMVLERIRANLKHKRPPAA